MRGTGRTTRQMLRAPKGAVFVWITGDLHYPRHLAAKHDREDLQIVGRQWLSREHWLGQEFPGVVVDHELIERLTPPERIALSVLQTRIRVAA